MLFMIKDKNILSLLKAIGNPIRLDILSFLISGEECVCNIFVHLDLPQNLVSHHLGILRKSYLIKARKNGKWVHYSLNISKFEFLKEIIAKFSVVKKNKCKSNC